MLKKLAIGLTPPVSSSGVLGTEIDSAATTADVVITSTPPGAYLPSVPKIMLSLGTGTTSILVYATAVQQSSNLYTLVPVAGGDFGTTFPVGTPVVAVNTTEAAIASQGLLAVLSPIVLSLYGAVEKDVVSSVGSELDVVAGPTDTSITISDGAALFDGTLIVGTSEDIEMNFTDLAIGNGRQAIVYIDLTGNYVITYGADDLIAAPPDIPAYPGDCVQLATVLLRNTAGTLDLVITPTSVKKP